MGTGATVTLMKIDMDAGILADPEISAGGEGELVKGKKRPRA